MAAAPQLSLDELRQRRAFVAAQGDAQVLLPNKRELGDLTCIYYMRHLIDTPNEMRRFWPPLCHAALWDDEHLTGINPVRVAADHTCVHIIQPLPPIKAEAGRDS